MDATMSDLVTVILITGLVGMATGLGAIPVFFQTSVSH